MIRSTVSPLKGSLLIALGLAAAPFAFAEQEWSFEVSAGVEQDSNVSINELDASTGNDDLALRLRAEIDFETDLTPETDLKFGYTISDKSFDEFSEFDLQTHILSGALSHDFGPVTAGGVIRYIDANLGGDGFQSITQFSPYASGYAAKNLFLRGALTHAEKEFDIQSARDADVLTFDADAYVFLDGSRRYIVVGLEQESSDANDAQFSYDGLGAQLRFSQRFKFRDRTARAQARWRFETRDFDGETPSIGAPREDDRNRFNVELELPITDTIFVAPEYEYGDFSSNLPSADYSQNVVSVRVGARF
ncbi:MAG: surface lipoprotein assembly modifier [Pseudomonadota bacterium]